MNEQDQKLLEQAVINLTLVNAKLKNDFTEMEKTKKMWYKAYTDTKKELEAFQEPVTA